MIGLDTNILLRLFLQDHLEQSAKSQDFFATLSEDEPGFINSLTLSEFAWVLRSRIKLSRQDAMVAISELLSAKDLRLEDEEVVEEALGIMSASPVEFADVLISLRNRKAGCDATKTFDRAAARLILGMDLLA